MKEEDAPAYGPPRAPRAPRAPHAPHAPHAPLTEAERDAIIAQALAILRQRNRKGEALTSTTQTANYLALELAEEPHEQFCVLYLDNKHRIIAFERTFQGTIDGASVYPRVIARQALEHNAAAVILAHNHPSGIANPSRADERITQRLKETLALLDVRVLDHFIVATEGHFSFAEGGLL